MWGYFFFAVCWRWLLCCSVAPFLGCGIVPVVSGLRGVAGVHKGTQVCASMVHAQWHAQSCTMP